MTTALSPAIAPELPGVLLDTSASRKLPIVMEMVAALSRAEDPNHVLQEFARGMSRMYGPQGYVSLSTRGLGPGEYKITRMVLEDLPQRIASADPWRDWERIPVRRGGVFGRIIRDGQPVVLHGLALRGDPVVGDALAGYRSMMAIPLFDGGEALNWAVTLRPQPDAFSVAELEETLLRANLGGAAVKNALMTRELRSAHAAIRREVEQIAKIQRALLPAELPEIPGLEIGVSYETFDQAGGDMYALRPLRPADARGPWGILVADVSGHGPAAAVVMAILQSMVESYPQPPAGPAEVLDHANRYLCAKRIESRFVTAFFAVYDPAARSLTYARAGHEPPVWMRSAEEGAWRMARLDGVGGVPLGVLDDTAYEEATIRLEPGQSLVLYTDGVTEAHAPDGTLFGIDGIEGSLTRCTGAPACAISHITASLKAHQADRRPRDDQTVVVLKVR
jgi:sigma-B regulation protein RsbU (phosphoserine phosphatase)